MPNFFNKYPYTDFHELNLDWVIEQMKTLQKSFEDFSAINKIIFADPIRWSITRDYGIHNVVINDTGNAYISLQVVPAGVDLNNTEYWMEIFDFSAYITAYDSNLTLNMEFNTDRATSAYNVDDWILIDNILYKVIAAIAVDDAFSEGVNIQRITVEQFIKAWVTSCINLINQYKYDIDESEAAYKQQLDQDIADVTASLQAQLDLAISGATVDSEVINARLGEDGITYTTLGNAIRTQFANVYDDISRDESVLFGNRTINLFDKNSNGILTGGFLDATNTFTSNTAFIESDYIPCTYGNTYTLASKNALLGSSRPVCFYDETKTFISGTNYPMPNIGPVVGSYYFRVPIKVDEINTFMIVENELTLQSYKGFYTGQPFNGKKIVALGDSILYNDGKTVNGEYRNGYPYYLQEAGFTVQNEGVSGACVAYHADRPYTDNVQTVDGISFNNYDYVLLQGGVNDYITSSPMGSMGSSPYDKTTFLGAYQYIIDKILTVNNLIRIVLMTPSRTYVTAYDVADGGPNAEGLYLKDYADAIKSIGAYYGLPVIDLDPAGINTYNIDDFTDDKLHLNNAGYKLTNDIMIPGFRNIII